MSDVSELRSNGFDEIESDSLSNLTTVTLSFFFFVQYNLSTDLIKINLRGCVGMVDKRHLKCRELTLMPVRVRPAALKIQNWLRSIYRV